MELLGGYRLIRRIGSGGMSVVWEALDADDRRVALKLISPAIANDPAARPRLAREVATLHRVQGRGIARVLDAEVEGRDAFIVTELISGPTLEDDVRAEGPFRPVELAGLAHGLAEALHAIHSAGIMHRDMKPSNVMMSPTGPVIIDFGIAQLADDVRLTQTGMVTGTPGYLDPEVINGANPTIACDWWGWAAVLAFAATGRRPFGTGPHLTVVNRMMSGDLDLAGVDEPVAGALREALRADSAQRLAPQRVLEALDQAARGARWAGPAEQTARLVGAADSTARLPIERTAHLPLARPAHFQIPSTIHFPPPEPWQQHLTTPEPWHPHYLPAPTPQPGQAPSPESAWPPPTARPLVTLAAGLVIAVGVAAAPGWGLLAIGVLLAATTALGLGSIDLRYRRMKRGPKRGDLARAALLAPWHFLRGAVLAAFHLLLAAGIGWTIVQGIRLILRATKSELASNGTFAVFVLAVFVMLLAAWYAPGADALREGTRHLEGILFPTRGLRVAFVVVALALAFIIAAVVVMSASGSPAWFPLPTPRWL